MPSHDEVLGPGSPSDTDGPLVVDREQFAQYRDMFVRTAGALLEQDQVDTLLQELDTNPDLVFNIVISMTARDYWISIQRGSLTGETTQTLVTGAVLLGDEGSVQ